MIATWFLNHDWHDINLWYRSGASQCRDHSAVCDGMRHEKSENCPPLSDGSSATHFPWGYFCCELSLYCVLIILHIDFSLIGIKGLIGFVQLFNCISVCLSIFLSLFLLSLSLSLSSRFLSLSLYLTLSFSVCLSLFLFLSLECFRSFCSFTTWHLLKFEVLGFQGSYVGFVFWTWRRVFYFFLCKVYVLNLHLAFNSMKGHKI